MTMGGLGDLEERRTGTERRRSLGRRRGDRCYLQRWRVGGIGGNCRRVGETRRRADLLKTIDWLINNMPPPQ